MKIIIKLVPKYDVPSEQLNISTMCVSRFINYKHSRPSKKRAQKWAMSVQHAKEALSGCEKSDVRSLKRLRAKQQEKFWLKQFMRMRVAWEKGLVRCLNAGIFFRVWESVNVHLVPLPPVPSLDRPRSSSQRLFDSLHTKHVQQHFKSLMLYYTIHHDCEKLLPLK